VTAINKPKARAMMKTVFVFIINTKSIVDADALRGFESHEKNREVHSQCEIEVTRL